MDRPLRAHLATGVLVAVGALVLTTGPLYRVRSWWSFDDPLAADPWVLGAQIAFGALGAVALASGGRWRRIDRRLAVVLVVSAGWMVTGALWSADAATTLRESAMIAVTLLAGMGAAAAIGERTLVVSAWTGVHLGLAWSAVQIIRVQPGTQDLSGDWTGVYFNRNSLALVAAFGILLSLVLVAQWWTHPRRWLIVCVIGASVLADLWLIRGAGSVTPLIALAMGATVAAGFAVVGRRWIAHRNRWSTDAGTVSAIAGAVVVAVASVAWLTRGTWLSALGRNTTLTGRTLIWEVSLDWAWRQPLHGHGYLGPWADDEFVADQLATRGELLDSSHNSFVEVFLGAGLVGLVLFVAAIALVWVAAGRRALTGRMPAAGWPLAALVFVIVEHLAETLWVGGQLTVALFGAIAVLSTSTDSSGDSSGRPPGAADDPLADGARSGPVAGAVRDPGVDRDAAEVVRGQLRN